jgi:cytochrome c oxidase cbb3-type subunit 3
MRTVALRPAVARLARARAIRLLSTTAIVLGLCLAMQTADRAAELGAAPHEAAEEYGEWLVSPKDLADVPVDRIARSLRMNGQALLLGKRVYAQHCAACHGADLKGLPEQHTPDLTDSEWRFSGDDLPSGGLTKYPSDIEWTVRYGIRSGHPNARGAEVNMIAFDPKYRTKDDTEDFGDKKFLTDEQIDEVVEYVLQLGGQQHDRDKAARGDVLFHDNRLGNCFDCHGDDGAGIDTFGSSNLTRRDLYLYGSDRASILESVVKGRHGSMPAFDGVLKPEELKAVSVFVFTRAAPAK